MSKESLDPDQKCAGLPCIKELGKAGDGARTFQGGIAGREEEDMILLRFKPDSFLFLHISSRLRLLLPTLLVGILLPTLPTKIHPL